jgi:cyclin T
LSYAGALAAAAFTAAAAAAAAAGDDAESAARWRVTAEDLRASPSVNDGMPYEDEQLLRRVECEYIASAGWRLFKKREPVAVAMYLFHRFFARRSMRKHDRVEVSSACMLLASKLEDNPRTHLHDVVEAHLQRTGRMPRVANVKELQRTEVSRSMRSSHHDAGRRWTTPGGRGARRMACCAACV